MVTDPPLGRAEGWGPDGQGRSCPKANPEDLRWTPGEESRVRGIWGHIPHTSHQDAHPGFPMSRIPQTRLGLRTQVSPPSEGAARTGTTYVGTETGGLGSERGQTGTEAGLQTQSGV